MVSLSLIYHLGLVSYCQMLYIINSFNSRILDDVQKSYFVILYMDKSNRIVECEKNYYNLGDFVRPILLFKSKCIRLFHI